MQSITPSKTSLLLGTMLAVLTGAALLILAAEELSPAPIDGQTPPEDLQRLLGGLGCGPAVDLSRCAFSFDPRLCEDCSLNHGPVPGGVYFCPQHACSILYCRPLTPQAHLRPRSEEEKEKE